MFFYILKGEKSTQSGAQLHVVISECYVRRKPGFHTDPAFSLAQFLPFVLSRRVVRATARDPPLRSTKGERGVYGGQSVSGLP